MARPHDIGGDEDYGPVEQRADEPPFDHLWQARVHAVHQQLVSTGVYTRDEGRDGIERLSAQEYRTLGYYERRFVATCRMLVERGVLTADDLAYIDGQDQP